MCKLYFDNGIEQPWVWGNCLLPHAQIFMFYVMNVAFLSDLWYNIYVRKDSVEISKIMYIAPKTL